jgi:hypothetical protein
MKLLISSCKLAPQDLAGEQFLYQIKRARLPPAQHLPRACPAVTLAPVATAAFPSLLGSIKCPITLLHTCGIRGEKAAYRRKSDI